MDSYLSTSPRTIDFHAFIHPASAFTHPDQVLHDGSLSRAEKRVILSSWASDAHTVESQPWLRQVPGGDHPVALAAILAALRRLDDDDPPPKNAAAIRPSDLARGSMPPPDCSSTIRWRRPPGRGHHAGLAGRRWPSMHAATSLPREASFIRGEGKRAA
ncbi:MAG: hypothetical protein JWR89_4228 [Tardiphaga sp.]|jgi:hypothetical protein|uniref:hypothetical protein n=1 Tax=Tardiphaga sp. TaxID=1926292 RepID=UPI00261A7E31|nr:hypothetical protein [Tardiphaga sp.]MDB5504326.1 hypothetical protein [Tardiphaga sp.]